MTEVVHSSLKIVSAVAQRCECSTALAAELLVYGSGMYEVFSNTTHWGHVFILDSSFPIAPHSSWLSQTTVFDHTMQATATQTFPALSLAGLWSNLWWWSPRHFGIFRGYHMNSLGQPQPLVHQHHLFPVSPGRFLSLWCPAAGNRVTLTGNFPYCCIANVCLIHRAAELDPFDHRSFREELDKSKKKN